MIKCHCSNFMCLELCCSKYFSGIIYLRSSQGNVYKLLFINGIISLILSGILQFALSFLNCNNYSDFFYDKDQICYGDRINTIIDILKDLELNKFLFLSILLIISTFIVLISIWLLIYNYTTIHFATIYTIPSFILFFIENIGKTIVIYYIIMFLIIILMALIYNEIIILNFCGLEKETKMEIIKRSDDDLAKKTNSVNTSTTLS